MWAYYMCVYMYVRTCVCIQVRIHVGKWHIHMSHAYVTIMSVCMHIRPFYLLLLIPAGLCDIEIIRLYCVNISEIMCFVMCFLYMKYIYLYTYLCCVLVFV